MQNTNEMPEQSTDTAEAPNRSSHSTYVNAAYPSDGHTPTSISGSKGSQNNLNTSGGSKKKADIFPLMKFKKRPISGVLNQDSELSCPICFEIISVAHVTKCGHSFCQNCISKALESMHRCPKCNTPCNLAKDVFPNFTLNQIIEKFKEESQNKKCKFSQSATNTIIDFINSANEDLEIEDVNQIINLLSQKKEELKCTSSKITGLLLHDFLKHFKQNKTDELSKLQQELQMINEDCKLIEQQYDANISITNDTDDQALSAMGTTTQNEVLEHLRTPKIQSLISNKKRIIHRYFDELSSVYIQYHNKEIEEANSRDCTTKGTPSSSKSKNVLDKIRETVSKITDHTQIRSIASVNYSNDINSLSSIVSSMDFDRSYEHFAVVGVTKKIKIYDFDTILERASDVHYPLYEITHNAKLSCVSWNSYYKNQLACSDYDGVVTLWDSEVGTLLKTYQEHEKRCWGVDFCEVDPRVLASASDDSKVKLWSTNLDYSILSIDAKSNVCCVAFKPDSKFHVLFGTADHCIHYYDLRNNKEPVRLFKGHKKAVSYVKFSGNNEFVSASTDSNLKSWKLNEGQCMKTYNGHVNEKNFVGLETYNGYIASGSENNTVYVYYNELTKPLLQYKFDDGGFMDKVKREESMNDFVSALCWSNQNILLAANSQGVVKVLELV